MASSAGSRFDGTLTYALANEFVRIAAEEVEEPERNVDGPDVPNHKAEMSAVPLCVIGVVCAAVLFKSDDGTPKDRPQHEDTVAGRVHFDSRPFASITINDAASQTSVRQPSDSGVVTRSVTFHAFRWHISLPECRAEYCPDPAS